MMKPTPQVRFWRDLGQRLQRGERLASAVKEARAAVVGEPTEGVVADLHRRIEAGTPLSQAMVEHEAVFPRPLAAMVRAGEAGGVLGIIAERIADGLTDGSFRLPGQSLAPEARAPALWRMFGRLLSSGVPILEVLELLEGQLRTDGLDEGAEAMQAIRRAVLDGQPIAEALRSFPDQFPAEVVAAVEAGERQCDLDGMAMRIADAIDRGNLASLPAPRSSAAQTEASEQVVRTVNDILAEAVRTRATDLHIEPLEGGRVRIRRRIDGVMHEAAVLPQGSSMPIAARLKAMSGMDLAERRLPQDGRTRIRLDGRDFDLRVSCLPTLHGERFTLRVISLHGVTFSLEAVDLSPENLAHVRRLIHMPQGIILVTGPTGSGKTTLLYSMLVAMDLDREMVVTIEDPVEYSFEKMSQVQVSPQTGMTFARAMRSILRQDPDVIMVGEIRDQEILMACIQASLTGHLVLSTIHTTSSPETVTRIADIGTPPFLINATIQAVITQKLARRLCKECRQPTQPDLGALPQAAREVIERLPEATWYSPKGCPACSQTGYHGRIAVHELMLMTDAIRQAVSTGGGTARIRQAAIESGMKTMLADGLAKAAQGVTSIEEVLRVTPREE